MTVRNKKNYPCNDQIVKKSTIEMFNLYLFLYGNKSLRFKIVKRLIWKILLRNHKHGAPHETFIVLEKFTVFSSYPNGKKYDNAGFIFFGKHFRMVEMLHYTILTYLFSNTWQPCRLVIDTTQIQCANDHTHQQTSFIYCIQFSFKMHKSLHLSLF